MDYRPSPPLPSSIARWLAILLVFCGVIPALAAEGRVALIIGNAAYTQKPLKNPVNDAEDLADFLKALPESIEQVGWLTPAQKTWLLQALARSARRTFPGQDLHGTP